MIAPNAPQSTPDPSRELYAPAPGMPEGAGAEQLQYRRARERYDIANSPPPATNGTFGGRPLTVAYADLPSPQIFEAHPKIHELAADAATGTTPLPHLPGRIPPTVWDGEPGAWAPNMVRF